MTRPSEALEALARIPLIRLKQVYGSLGSSRSRMQGLTRSVGAFVTLLFAISANGQTPPDFTGHWRRQTNAGEQRQLDIEQKGNALRVETTVTNSKGTRRLEVTYQIGGPETVYKGLDGDEFHSRAHWDGSVLVFDTVEHERGRRIPEITVWTLSEDRNSIQLKRQSTKSGKDSSVTYVRQP
jgi:hypothetical protein